jgi:hypothetical protein
MSNLPLRLRQLPMAARLSLSFLMLVVLGGYLVSGLHMSEHHQNRDGREGLSMTDIEGAYHGVNSQAPLLLALNADHPAELEGQGPLEGWAKKALLQWLEGDPDKIVPNWDNLDLGDEVPADLLDASCVSCHSRTAAPELRADPPLEYLDDIRAVAFSREISPSDIKILIASTHAHSLGLATITLLLVGLIFATRFGPRLKGGLALAASGGLLFDLAAWWLARESASFVLLIVLGGAAHAGAMVLIGLLVLAELWCKDSKAKPQAS